MKRPTPSSGVLRIALVDDHVLFRDGLRALMSSQRDMLVVAEASDAREALPLIEANEPGVVVVDITLQGASGVTLAREVLRVVPSCKVLVLTMHANEDYLIQALAVGVTGYALKSQPAEEVLDAIRTVGAGRPYLAPTLPRPSSYDTEARRKDEAGSRLDDLSAREREIFDLLIQNFSNLKIGQDLFISVKTVQTHRASINRKLGIHSTAELMRFAALRGLIHD